MSTHPAQEKHMMRFAPFNAIGIDGRQADMVRPRGHVLDFELTIIRHRFTYQLDEIAVPGHLQPVLDSSRQRLDPGMQDTAGATPVGQQGGRGQQRHSGQPAAAVQTPPPHLHAPGLEAAHHG